MSALVGKTVGKYQIIEPLGSGGMSRVYRAYHAQLDRYVAVKVLRTDLIEDDKFLARFQREAQAVAALRHPNIVQIYDFDIHEETSYMVMELLDGDTLKTRLNDYRVRGERMPYGEILRILLDVLEGLAYAHQEQMIHRDIKPANILLTKQGQAVLADFGIAQMVGQTRHTMSGALMGTLAYMAPEQGLEGKCDNRSDLYSLGIVLYEMLTQHPPYDADTPLAVLMKHLNDPLPLPPVGNIDIPPALEHILLKALSKKPEHRYQQAEKMSEALQMAAHELGVTIPNYISPPLSFTTEDAPAEPVAIFSGTAQQRLSNADFAADVTDPTLSERLKAEAKEMIELGETAVATESASTPSIFTAIAVIIGTNFAAITLSALFDNWQIFERGWPFELIVVGWFFIILMQVTRNIWLFIPAAILLGNGVLMSFYALTDAWDLWGRLWPLEPMLVFGTVFATIKLSQNNQRAQELIEYISSSLHRPIIALLGLVFVGSLIV